MKLTAAWVGLLVVTMVGGCSGRLDEDIEAYKQAAARPGSGGTGGSRGGTGGAAGSAAGAMGGTAGAQPAAPKPMGSADGGGWNDSGSAPTPPTPPRAPSDGGAVAEAGGSAPAPAADARPAQNPSSASACPNGLDALTIMVQKCGACHGERTPTKGLDLTTAGVANRLVGVRSACNARPFLDPAATNSAASYFIEKLDGPVAGCGGQMPFGAPALNRDERNCLVEWADRAIARGQVGR